MIDSIHRLLVSLVVLSVLGPLAACRSGPPEDWDRSQVTASATGRRPLVAGTYRFGDGSGVVGGSGPDAVVVDDVLRQAIRSELRGRGFSERAVDPVDYEVTYVGALTEALDREAILWQTGIVLQPDASEDEDYPGGTLLVFVHTGGGGSLLWRGSVQALTTADLEPAEREARLGPFVRGLFRSFPSTR